MPVILFLVDTLRADHLGCYGYGRDTSPALDALAEDGVVFENCQAQSSWTKPATASVLTGLLPSQHRAVHKIAALPPEHMLLAEPLRAAGYRTAAFGGNAFIFGPEQGFGRGFDVFESSSLQSESAAKHAHLSADALVDASLDWLEAALESSTDERLFLYVHVVDPHDPYAPPAELRDRFSEPLGAGLPSDAELARPAPVAKRYPEGPPGAVLERMVGLYDAEILAADRAFGRLVDELERRGLYDEAMIVFVADHGEEFFDHSAYGHNPRLYQEVVHVPLVVKFPAGVGDGLAGRRFAPRVRQVDILPTVLDVLGIEVEAELAGASLLQPLVDADRLTDWSFEPAVTEVDSEGVYRKSLIQGDYEYVRTWAPDQTEVLFDLASDPGEHRDLAAAEEDRLGARRADLGRLARVGERGWGLMLGNRTDQPLRVAGLITFTGAALEGLDPMRLELEGVADEQLDGPVGQGWLTVEPRGDGRGRIQYGEGPTLDEAGMDAFPELPLGGLGAFRGRAARFFAVLEPGGVDGLLFVPAAESSELRLMLWAEAKPVPATYVLLGPDAQPAQAMPLRLGTGEGLEMPAPSMQQGPQDRPLFAWVWKNLDPGTLEIEFSPETEANLRGLGYLGDE